MKQNGHLKTIIIKNKSPTKSSNTVNDVFNSQNISYEELGYDSLLIILFLPVTNIIH